MKKSKWRRYVAAVSTWNEDSTPDPEKNALQVRFDTHRCGMLIPHYAVTLLLLAVAVILGLVAFNPLKIIYS